MATKAEAPLHRMLGRGWRRGRDQRAPARACKCPGTAVFRTPPVNLGDLPAAGSTRQNATVKVAPLQLTPLDQMPARRSSWSSAPRVELLPEKLLLIGYRNGKIDLERASLTIQTPLAAGPDPNAPPDEQLQPDGDSIKIPEELRWMFDFETALEMGMAFRIDLTPDQAARGFDRLIVLGVRVSDDAATGRQSLERLIEHHLLSRTGPSIVPQGTPTNNTEKGAAGPRFGDDPEAGFAAFYQQRPLYTVENNPMARRDGQWLAETLGLAHSLVQRIPNAEGADQIDARAMHAALFPSTLGYMMRTMLQPVFDEHDIDATREFMAHYVSGRGWIPEAAKRFFRKTLKHQGWSPRRMVTDKLRSYGAARRGEAGDNAISGT